MSNEAKRRLLGRSVAFVALALALVLMATYLTHAQTQPSGNTRQPIVGNQFSTTTNGALQERRPGTYVQQGTAVQQGSADFIVGDAMPAEPGFYRETFELLALQVIDIISQLLQSLNLLTGANPLSGLTDGLGLTGNITNPLTNGGGGSVNIQ